jgi:hypothetical protein
MHESNTIAIVSVGSLDMAPEPPELKDETFYGPLFDLILSKLQETGRTDLEIFIGELFPIIPSDFDGEDVYEAIMQLVAKGVIQRENADGDTFIELIED